MVILLRNCGRVAVKEEATLGKGVIMANKTNHDACHVQIEAI